MKVHRQPPHIFCVIIGISEVGPISFIVQIMGVYIFNMFLNADKSRQRQGQIEFSVTHIIEYRQQKENSRKPDASHIHEECPTLRKTPSGFS